MPRKKSKTQRRSVSIPADLIPKIEERAKKERRGFGNMVEVILFEHLEAQEDKFPNEASEVISEIAKASKELTDATKSHAKSLGIDLDKGAGDDYPVMKPKVPEVAEFPEEWEDKKKPEPKKGKKSDDKVTFD